MSRLTNLETECQDVMAVVMNYLTTNASKRSDAPQERYMTILNLLRNSMRHLENKEYGCNSGLHSSHCDCRPGIPGENIQYRKATMRMINEQA